MALDLRAFRGLSAAVAAAMTLTSSGALAADPPPRLVIGGDLRWWSGDTTGSVFPIVPFVHYEVVPRVVLDFDFPIAPQSGGRSFGALEDEPKSRFGLGNPMLGAHVESAERGSPFVFLGGIRVGIPLASFGDVDSDRAGDLASAANAHADFYHWVPELFPMVASLGFEAHPSGGLWIRLPLEIMLLVPTTERRTVKTGISARFEMEGRGASGFGGGGALQLVVSDGFRTRREDTAQTSIEPYFIYDSGRFFVRFGIITALDRPLGFGLEKGGVISADLRVGGGLF